MSAFFLTKRAQDRNAYIVWIIKPVVTTYLEFPIKYEDCFKIRNEHVNIKKYKCM